MVPQLPAKESTACSAEKLLIWMGQVLKAATKANGDVPPASLAFDGGTKNSMINKVFLGCIPPTQLADMVFWKRLSFMDVPVMLFPFKLAHLDAKFPMVACNGPYHVSKRASLQALSGARKVMWGSIAVCYASMLKGGLSLKAFCCQDSQSDKQAAQRLNVCQAPRDFDDWGVRVHAFVIGLCQSGWASAAAFEQEDQQKNLLTCYYLVLLGAMFAQYKHARFWERHFLPGQTVKNLLALCGHGILGNLMDAGWADFRTELTIEKAFSEVKRPYRGVPNTKDAILGAHLHHLRQLKALRSKPSPLADASTPRTPLSMERTKVLGKQALQDACMFQALITLDGHTAEETLGELLVVLFCF